MTLEAFPIDFRTAVRTPASEEGLSGTNLERAGDHNQRVTLQAIRARGPITRADLADITNLTAPAIANITRRLLNEGLVLKAGRLTGGRGQPATQLIVNPDGAFSIGLNIDRDHITIVALDFVGQVRFRTSREVHFAMPDEVRAFVAETMDTLRRKRLIDFDRLIGMGIGMPDDLGRVRLPHRPEAYDMWSEIDVQALFAGLIDAPVVLENDAAAAAIGEMQFGHGMQSRSFIYTLISAGLGGGLVINGHYFRGADGRSGEIGFLPIGSDAQSETTLQDVVSLYALYERLARNGIRACVPADLESLSPQAQAVVDSWLDEAAQHLYMPFLTLNCALNPEAHFIGGRMPAAIIDGLCARLNSLYARLSDRRLPPVAPVRRAALAIDACACGAGILPFNERFLPIREALMKSA